MQLDSLLTRPRSKPLPPRSVPPPAEVFPAWPPAQRIAMLNARDPMPSIAKLRAAGFLPLSLAKRIVEWYVGPAMADGRQVELAYAALADEVIALAQAVIAPLDKGGLGVRVNLVPTPGEPYPDAATLCHDVRERRAITLRAASVDPPHPVLRDEALDHLHAVHDVLGHAALGLGFDLQSEYAAWLYCRPLFSETARPAAFCELAGAVTTYVLTGARPRQRADLPPTGC